MAGGEGAQCGESRCEGEGEELHDGNLQRRQLSGGESECGSWRRIGRANEWTDLLCLAICQRPFNTYKVVALSNGKRDGTLSAQSIVMMIITLLKSPVDGGSDGPPCSGGNGA